MTWYADSDGFGDPERPVSAPAAPAGAVADRTDCDDTLADVHPGAPETCDGVDQDCDTVVDEAGAVGEVAWWPDTDGDGFGDPNQPSLLACRYGGRIDNDDDCDDTRDDVHPGGVEVCDADDADEDCDGLADDADVVDLRTRTLWYADSDADGFGDPARPQWACDPPIGFEADARDCDDGDAAIFPGAPERCNGVDDDCEPTTPAMDPGTVVRVTPDFTFQDVTGEWLGSATSPAEVTTAPGTYWVCDGTWFVTIDAALDVAIFGPGGSGRTVLDGGGAGTVLTVDVADVTLSGVTLRNGEGDQDIAGAGGRDGGAVACLGGSFSATDVVFSDNHADYGGALAGTGFCEVTVEDSVFLDNTADVYGGAVYADQITLTVSGTDFLGGTATRGGGAYMAEALSPVDFEDCLFRENAAADGAALYLQKGVFSCTGTTTTVAGFYANDASAGAAVTVGDAWSAPFEAKTCDFGVEGTADDNSTDVRLLGTNFAYGDDESFTCDRTGCG